MALADISEQTITVTCGGASFNVGALSAGDLADLRRQHVTRLLDMIVAYGEFLQQGDVQRIYGLTSILLEMSDGVAHTIALAAREPQRIDEASRLPFGVQLQALIAIASLTFAGEMVGGLAPAILDLLAQVEALRPEEIN